MEYTEMTVLPMRSRELILLSFQTKTIVDCDRARDNFSFYLATGRMKGPRFPVNEEETNERLVQKRPSIAPFCVSIFRGVYSSLY